jgi:Protein of unknown function (DUF2384)
VAAFPSESSHESHDLRRLIAELEAEAHAEGPEAVADLKAFRLYFSRLRSPQRAVLSSLALRLAHVIHPTHVLMWLTRPIPALNGDTPIERITSADDERSVARLVSGLEDPGAS